MCRAYDVAIAALAPVAIFPDERRRFVAMVHDHARHRINVRTVVARDHDRFTPIRKNPSPRILRLVRGAVKTIELQQSRTQSPQPGLFERRNSPRRLDMRVNVQSLAHEQLAAVAPDRKSTRLNSSHVSE